MSIDYLITTCYWLHLARHGTSELSLNASQIGIGLRLHARLDFVSPLINLYYIYIFPKHVDTSFFGIYRSIYYNKKKRVKYSLG